MGKRLPVEPTWLNEATVLAIHANHVERFGGTHGVRDEGLLYTLCAKPRQKWVYDDGATLGALASVYLTGIARGNSFYSANESTALACALVFLALNGVPQGAIRSMLADEAPTYATSN